MAFGGDQLTCEKSKKCQQSRINSQNGREALLGLAPFAGDWHAEATLLQVCCTRTMAWPCVDTYSVMYAIFYR